MPTIKINKRGGRLFRLEADGTETEMPAPRQKTEMTEAEIHAAAVSDSDCPATSPDDPPRRQRPRSFIIRRALKLTPEQFCARYGIDLATLQRWENYELEPDGAARSLLLLIANDPDGVAAQLAGTRRAEAAE
jgi:putative transcriptional regulator